MPVVTCVTDPTANGLITRPVPAPPSNVFVVEGNVPLEVAVTGDTHDNMAIPAKVPFVGYPTILVNNKPMVLDSTPSPDGGKSTMTTRKVIAS